MTVTIRKIESGDLDSILAIENASFAAPWSQNSFLAELSKDYSRILCAEENDQIIGYLIAWFIFEEIHIANLAVRLDKRRLGIGRALVQRVIKDAGAARWITLEVRKSNRAARHLYETLGFRETGIRRNYYANENEDAIIMQKWLHSQKKEG